MKDMDNEIMLNKIKTMIYHLNYGSQNPAFYVTKDDIIELLTEIFNNIDCGYQETLSEFTDLKSTCHDAYYDLEYTIDTVRDIENDLKFLKDKLKNIDKYITDDIIGEVLKPRCLDDYIETENIDLEDNINEIDSVIDNLKDVKDRLETIQFDLDI